MSFSIAGSVITQTGTDTDLSGLSAIAGVSALSGTYHLNGLRLRVTGSLTIDHRIERLVLANLGSLALEVMSGATLNIGVQETVGGFTDTPIGTAIVFDTCNYTTWNVNDSQFTVRDGATLNWRGGIVHFQNCNVNGIYVFFGAATVNGKNCALRKNLVTANTQFRCAGTTLNVDGLTTERFLTSLINISGNLLGFSPRWSATMVSPSRPGWAVTTIRDFSAGQGLQTGLSLSGDVMMYAGAGYTPDQTDVLNCNIGSDMLVNLAGDHQPNAVQQMVMLRKRLVVSVRDGAGIGLSNVRMLIRDKNNGARSTVTNARNGTENLTTDRVYVQSSSGGNIPATDVLTAIFYKLPTDTIAAAARVDRRGDDGTSADLFTAFFKGYSTTVAQKQFALRGLGDLNDTVPLLYDQNVTFSEAQAGALTTIATLDDLYDAAKWWATRPVAAQLEYPSAGAQPVTASGAALNLGNRNLVIDANAAAAFAINTATNTITVKSLALAAGAKFKSLTTTGTVAFVNGATSSGIAIEDVNGVRVTVRKSGGGNFNIAARYGTTGSYTDLGFQSDVSTVTYTVPKGQPVEVIMWSLGYVTYGRTISTVDGGVVFDAEMVLNPNINTALDVSNYISNITVTNGGGLFNVTFNAPMTVSGIELGKAVIHRLVGQEVALKAGFPPGSTATIEILADEIKNNLPAVRLAVGAGLSVTDRVYLDFFINTTPALTINPSYVINPVRADGNQVQILRAKPALDSSQLAAAVRDELQTELSRMDVAVSTRLATTAYTAPANADIAAIKAKTDTLVNAPTLAQIEASTVLAKEVTVSTRASQTSVNAIPTNPLLATDARLNNLDTTVSSRLAAASYTEPPTVAAIRADIERTGGMLDTVPTLAEVEASTILAKQSGFTGLATAANVTNAQTAIVTEINANETKIDAVKTDTAAIKLKTDALVNAPTLAQIEASTVLAKQSGFAGLATAANVVDAQTAIVTEVNANETKIDAIKVDTAAIKAKTDTLVNTDISGLPTLTQIEASSVLAKASDVSTVDTKVTAIKAKTDTLVNAPTVADIEASTVLAKEATVASKASQSSVNALGSPMQASAYVTPDNTKIAEIKTKVDTLQNTDLTAVNSGIADIKGTGFDATKHNLVAIKRQASLAAALSV